MHFVPIEVTDSAGFTHTMRMRLTANVVGPLTIIFFIDLLCLCPAHYWLTLYDITRDVNWNRHGNARITVESVASAADGLSHTELLHFSSIFYPSLLTFMYHQYSSGNWQQASMIAVVLAVVTGGQRFFGVISGPRAAIVRFRGPATQQFAFASMRNSVIVAVLCLFWCARGVGYWMDEPWILPVLPPNSCLPVGKHGACVRHPTQVEGDYINDRWQGLSCSGFLTGDPDEPWVINVSGCVGWEHGDGMFINRDDLSPPNATLPSLWTGIRYRRYLFMFQPTFMTGWGLVMFAQPIVGVGMCSGFNDLRYDWLEVLTGATFIGWLMLVLMGFAQYFSENPSPVTG
eukprot:SAG11_NODE_8286_length_1034_cov_0.985027_1_plen_344_part_11